MFGTKKCTSTILGQNKSYLFQKIMSKKSWVHKFCAAHKVHPIPFHYYHSIFCDFKSLCILWSWVNLYSLTMDQPVSCGHVSQCILWLWITLYSLTIDHTSSKSLSFVVLVEYRFSNIRSSIACTTGGCAGYTAMLCRLCCYVVQAMLLCCAGYTWSRPIIMPTLAFQLKVFPLDQVC